MDALLALYTKEERAVLRKIIGLYARERALQLRVLLEGGVTPLMASRGRRLLANREGAAGVAPSVPEANGVALLEPRQVHHLGSRGRRLEQIGPRSAAEPVGHLRARGVGVRRRMRGCWLAVRRTWWKRTAALMLRKMWMCAGHVQCAQPWPMPRALRAAKYSGHRS